MSPLRRRMIDDMQIRSMSAHTQRKYVAIVFQIASHFGKSPELLGPEEIRTYLIHLTQERRLSASSIVVAVSALRFFYTVTLKQPWTVENIPTSRIAKRLPVIMSRDEVARFLAAVDNLKHRMILTLCYGTGLRISEAVRLKPAAIDSQRMVIRVDQGKGRKDRYVMLPPTLLAMLRDYWCQRRSNFGSPALSVLVELVLEDWIGERPGLTSVVLCPCPLLCRPSFPACSG